LQTVDQKTAQISIIFVGSWRLFLMTRWHIRCCLSLWRMKRRSIN